jgi:uncharacterized membrane protein YhaH (DUF805 family)
MDFMSAVRSCLSNYVTFSGRAPRSEYWWFFLFNIIGAVVTNVIDVSVIGMPLTSIIWSLALILPGIAVSVRRMHDLDKSGWWIFIGLIPILGLILIIYWFVSRGTEGANRFGSDPLGGGLRMARA